ncbi:MAG TPA: hypothetical protein EYO01_02195 [Phycisphaerales bacterium]|jgi:hypothetical protein|nr:hypothetical protein [Phycisphaerales bacterium]HIB49694.1 hypothetical protein [Phycisphaerales bacterium]HIN84569.1 hypothetical protein [Phycisphaerales bacterium]HIO20074.1 hypothetical protein [Phycisphaerales bacterium]HIO52912.1 hypothetical protein [Phycisphaerales bacterium]
MSKDLVTIISPTSEFEANVLAIVLKDNGIDAFVFGTPAIGMGVTFSAGVVGVPVQVRREDVEIARQILIDNKRDSIDIDWDDFECVDGEENYDAYRPMPITARVAFFCVVLALIAGLLVFIIQLTSG